ncbi:MAG TPA: ABC transporter substrate-binding protein [Acetobacteraceae bacterium]|nr:ABC transporter substrate-binding protein [Acetobacteraceae bacterium]
MPSPASRLTSLLAMLPAFVLAMGVAAAAHANDVTSRITISTGVSIPAAWFDPAETPGSITPFLVLYALHDSMLKPMPAGPLTPSLAEWSQASEDGLTYEFMLRAGAKFHNGEPVTAEDVKFSFERYRGTGQAEMKRRVRSIDVAGGDRIRFNLAEPWPDFLTFYASATGAGWVVPKAYIARVGEDGFKKAPIGAGPYKFVSFTPGIELVMEAFDQYWRKAPSVKRLVIRSIPDDSTRFAALKLGEIDEAGFGGDLARQVQQTPGLKLKAFPISVSMWLDFPGKWDPKSPWHDERVRRAVSFAIDRQEMNQALQLGSAHITGSIFPENYDFYWQPPAPEYDPGKAKQLLADAGYPQGFDAGDYYCDASVSGTGEAIVNNLREVGIRAQLRPLERAAFFTGWGDKKFKTIVQGWSGAFGNVATRLQAFVVAGGTYAYGSYSDLDELYRRQATEMDRDRRAAILTEIQRDVYDRAMFAPIWQLGVMVAV